MFALLAAWAFNAGAITVLVTKQPNLPLWFRIAFAALTMCAATVAFIQAEDR
ncbi:MAG: hypothetical protein PHS14_14520 [Elusimicrobia bacterium]|nr:hypothetical protein [Elusimicrobiota bacterium]